MYKYPEKNFIHDWKILYDQKLRNCTDFNKLSVTPFAVLVKKIDVNKKFFLLVSAVISPQLNTNFSPSDT